jgi:Hypoxia induced protein conserved region
MWRPSSFRAESRAGRIGSDALPAIRNDITPDPGYIAAMSYFMSHVAVPIAVGAVALVLLLGLINMMRGGSPWTSQKLMRLRVVLQFVAIVVILFAAWVMSK